jgi:membrane protease subunit HflC
MKRNLLALTVALVLVILFGFLLFTFQVRTTEVAVVTTFGKPTRPITTPGFKVKWPWPIQRVHKFDQRIHTFESKFEQVLTPDGYNLLIMVYAGWNIKEPQSFFPRFGDSIVRAEENLEGLIRNAYSGVVGKHPFSHFISTDEKELKFVEIENEMLQKIQADARANDYGIEIKFLGIKKLGLPESVTQLVFDRMKSERAVRENEIKYEGERQARAIRDAADLESAKLLTEADAQATRIRGEGEKAAAASLTVFQQNPALGEFLLKLNGLELFLKERTTLILDPKTPPLDLLIGTPVLERPSSSVAVPGAETGVKLADPDVKSVPAGKTGKHE